MKRSRVLNKNIITSSDVMTTTPTAVVIKTFAFPSTLFGFHYTCTARILSSVSTFANGVFALMVVPQGQTVPELNVFTTAPIDLLKKGTEEQVLVSDWLLVIRELTSDPLGPTEVYETDKRSGQIKTQRRVQVGDRLMLIHLSDSAIGIGFKFMLTYWEKT